MGRKWGPGEATMPSNHRPLARIRGVVDPQQSGGVYLLLGESARPVIMVFYREGTSMVGPISAGDLPNLS